MRLEQNFISIIICHRHNPAVVSVGLLNACCSGRGGHGFTHHQQMYGANPQFSLKNNNDHYFRQPGWTKITNHQYFGENILKWY